MEEELMWYLAPVAGDCPGFGCRCPGEARQVIQAFDSFVNRGMTVGTPDVVTAISMVKRWNWTEPVALTKKKYQR